MDLLTIAKNAADRVEAASVQTKCQSRSASSTFTEMSFFSTA